MWERALAKEIFIFPHRLGVIVLDQLTKSCVIAGMELHDSLRLLKAS